MKVNYVWLIPDPLIHHRIVVQPDAQSIAFIYGLTFYNFSIVIHIISEK